LHGRLDLPDLPLTAQRFARAPFVSISQSHPDLTWLATIHHGLPPDLLKLSSCKPSQSGGCDRAESIVSIVAVSRNDSSSASPHAEWRKRTSIAIGC
jgi:hypothetical protein